MMDMRLIDYSEGYRDYGDELGDEDLELALGDMLLILDGFLMRYGDALTGDRPEGGARSGGINNGDRGERLTAMPGQE